ncbi:MAG: hypothetical protein R3277_01665 [Brumimicrobium sp.]|nr:hypothetical protein [Brumimicrobium sp.]
MKTNQVYWMALCLILVIGSCVNEEKQEGPEVKEVTPESMMSDIKEMDDSLEVLFAQRMKSDNFEIDRLVYHEAINRNKAFYMTYPDHSYAPKAAEKIASMYLQLNIEPEAIKWRDTILINYPDFERKLDILELQKAAYDNFDTYDKEKIIYYSDEMLKMEGLPEEKKKDIQFRLENIDLTFRELIKLQNPDLEM